MEIKEVKSAKISAKSMESAMIAYFIKQCLNHANDYELFWMKDDGKKIKLHEVTAHPSFPNKESANKRLTQRIEQWLSGEKPGLDKNAIVRLSSLEDKDTAFDLSMESFEKAALGDNGILIISVGLYRGVGREPMDLQKMIQIEIVNESGLMNRAEALNPIKDLINEQKKIQENHVKFLKDHEKNLNELTGARKENHDLIKELKEKERLQDFTEPVIHSATSSPFNADPSYNQESQPQNWGKEKDVKPTFREAQVKSSQVRLEEKAPPIDPQFIKAVFPELPEGCDEVHLTIEKKRLFEVLEALDHHGTYELRMASKGVDFLNIGLCVPSGNLPILSDFLSNFAQGGVMLKRVPVNKDAKRSDHE